jgi:hypothetical protein
MTTKAFFALAATLLLSVPLAANADYGGRGGYGQRHWAPRPHYYVPPPRPHYYYPRAPYWHTGYWHRGYHGARFGWWWVVGPDWFYYPRVTVAVPVRPAPPAIVVQPSAPAAAPPVQTWYYCRAADEYYPHVSSCDHWEEVPATPSR